MVESGNGAPDVESTEDFDAFWREQDRKGVRLSNVFGVDIELPAELPLRFEIEAKRLAASEDFDDIRHLVGVLFGDDALDQWTAAGMDVEQFGVLLMWGSANAAGQRMTLAEARVEYHKQEAAKGKAPVPNRADKRAAARKPRKAGA